MVKRSTVQDAAGACMDVRGRARYKALHGQEKIQKRKQVNVAVGAAQAYPSPRD